jgi:hypothetical protein
MSTIRVPLPQVFWLIAALRSLRATLAVELAGPGNDTPFQQWQRSLSGRLAAHFPRARAVVVRDRMAGYRPSPVLHVLLIEVILRPDQDAGGDADDPGVSIVKVGDAEDMAEELGHWETCCPPRFTHDNHLITLHGEHDPDTRQLVALAAYRRRGCEWQEATWPGVAEALVRKAGRCENSIVGS